jgi:Transposase DDE domain
MPELGTRPGLQFGYGVSREIVAPLTVPRSRRACSARMSCNMTQTATAMFALPVGVFFRIHRRFCAGCRRSTTPTSWRATIAKIRSQCTNGLFRTVSRLENEAVLDRMQARLAQRPSVLDRRREAVEHPFGSIKQWMNQGAFLMRGLEKVRAEFSLTALAYNLRRVLNLVGFTELMAALAA